MAFKDWSTTAASNGNADAGINWQEGQAPSTVNGSAREMMAVLKNAFGHIVSVKDYGAVGDGSTDDTTAIQSCITANISNSGGVVIFPAGTYRITSSLTIPASAGWRIFGQSRASAIIRQDTNNTPIFTLTACDTHSWNISDLRLTWNSAQASTNTSAIAIYMSGASGTAANGYYNWQVERVTFANGFRGINANETIQLSVWGFKVDGCQTESTMSGALVRIVPNPSIGMPNIQLKNLFIRCDSMKEECIRILGGNGMSLDSIEVANGTISSTNMAAGVRLTSCLDVFISNLRYENQTIASDVFALLDFAGSRGVINGFEIAGVIVSSAITGYGLKVTSSGNAAVSGSNTTATLSGGGAFFTFAGQTFRRLENYTSSGATGTKDPSINIVYDDQLANAVSADTGDSARNVAVYNTERTIRWASPLTADRAVNLSTTGVMNGNKFHVVRTAAATGASNLNVGTGPLKALAVGQWCDVEYNGSAWMLTASGSL